MSVFTNTGKLPTYSVSSFLQGYRGETPYVGSFEKAYVGKEACGDMMEYFSQNPKKLEEYKERKQAEKARKKKQTKEAALQIKGRPETPKSKEHAEAGTYRKGHARMQGLNITIENAKGQYRQGVSSDGKKWKTLMKHHYGYIKGTLSDADGDHIDVFVGPDTDSEAVFVVNQVDPKSGKFDEHKCMLGFTNSDAAKKGYLDNYEKGWKGISSITPMTMDQFKIWTNKANTARQAKPFTKIASLGFITAYKQAGMREELILFLKANPNPQDSDFHAWAEGKGYNVHDAEAQAYAIATEHLNEKEKVAVDLTGKADKENESASDVPAKELRMGKKVETEHTFDSSITKQIALDHLAEFPDYYTRLKEMEDTAKKEKVAAAVILSVHYKEARDAGIQLF